MEEAGSILKAETADQVVVPELPLAVATKELEQWDKEMTVAILAEEVVERGVVLDRKVQLRLTMTASAEATV